jgi:hypothetical protein
MAMSCCFPLVAKEKNKETAYVEMAFTFLMTCNVMIKRHVKMYHGTNW